MECRAKFVYLTGYLALWEFSCLRNRTNYSFAQIKLIVYMPHIVSINNNDRMVLKGAY